MRPCLGELVARHRRLVGACVIPARNCSARWALLRTMRDNSVPRPSLSRRGTCHRAVSTGRDQKGPKRPLGGSRLRSYCRRTLGPIASLPGSEHHPNGKILPSRARDPSGPPCGASAQRLHAPFERFAKHAGYAIAETFWDPAVSGARGPRPSLARTVTRATAYNVYRKSVLNISSFKYIIVRQIRGVGRLA